MDSAGTTTLLGGVVGSGGAAGEVIFVGATPFETDPVFFWDDTNKRLGVGTATPATKFHAYTTAIENAGIFEVGVADHNPYNAIQLRRTRSDTTAPNADFGVGISFNLEGFTSGTIAQAGSIRVIWEVNQTNNTTDRDGAMTFLTTLNNTVAEKMRLSSAGHLSLTGGGGILVGAAATATAGQIYVIQTAVAYAGWFEISVSDHNPYNPILIRRSRSDTTAPNAGFGVGISAELEGFTNGSGPVAGNIRWIWEVNQTNDTTDRDSAMVFQTMLDNSLGERMRLTSNGYLQVGSGAIGSASTVGVFSAFTTTATSATSFNAGYFLSTASAASASSASVRGMTGAVTVTTANYSNNTIAIYGLSSITATTGTVAAITGVYGQANLAAAAAATSLYGVIGVTGMGAASGNITTAASLYADASYRIAGTGVISSAYGLYINTQAAAHVTTPFGIWQNGSSDFNYFVGKSWFTNNTGITRAANDAQLNAYGGPSFTTAGWAKAIKMWTGHAIAFGADYNNPSGPYWGAGASGGQWYLFYTTAQDNSAAPTYMITISTTGFAFAGGIAVGGPTGGVPGAGGINVALNIYKNNTAYTNPDYALEWWATGRIVAYADKPGAKGYRRWTLGEVEDHIRQHFRLPRIKDEPTGIFDMADIALEKIEELFTHLIELDKRVKALES